jgi:hypothetical protein
MRHFSPSIAGQAQFVGLIALRGTRRNRTTGFGPSASIPDE